MPHISILRCGIPQTPDKDVPQKLDGLQRKVSTSPGSDDAPAYSPDGKYLAFRSQARAGYESDRFRLMLYDRKAQNDEGIATKSGPEDRLMD